MYQELQLGRLKIGIESGPDQVEYVFSGSVDEGFLREEIPVLLKKDTILNLAGISNFNSCGIREWVFWVQELSGKSRLHFVACSIPMIDQINMIPQSLGNGKVESFYAPYFCEKCGEVNRLIEMREHRATVENKKSPLFHCETCGARLIFDTMDSSYFLFIDHQKNLSHAS